MSEWESRTRLLSLEQIQFYMDYEAGRVRPALPAVGFTVQRPDPPASELSPTDFSSHQCTTFANTDLAAMELGRRDSSGSLSIAVGTPELLPMYPKCEDFYGSQSVDTLSSVSTLSTGPSREVSHPSPDLLPLCSRDCYRPELYPDQPTCHACKREFMDVADKRIRKLHCGHIFHRSCIDPQLNSRQCECPSCRSPVPDEWYGQPTSGPRPGFWNWAKSPIAKNSIIETAKDEPARAPKHNPCRFRKCYEAVREIVAAATRPFIRRPERELQKVNRTNESWYSLPEYSERRRSWHPRNSGPWPLRPSPQRFPLD